jgi:glycosyltransferase involved in cell wall biosynthesis
MKLLIEASPIEQDRPSGVNYFTEWLARALDQKRGDDFGVEYFFLNFLGRKPLRNPLSIDADKDSRFYEIKSIPQRLYAKLVYGGIAPPIILPKSDWVLFPNFYIWPVLPWRKRAVIIHDIGYLVYPEYVEDKNREFLDKVATGSMKQAEMIITNSQFTTDEIVSRLGIDESKIVTLNIPVDGTQFDQSLDLGAQHLADKFDIKKKYILSVGTLEPRKNLETTILAYCELPKTIRNEYALVLAGKWGWKTESIRRLIEEKQQMGYDIVVTNHVDNTDRATLYRNASVYAIASHYEGFGMPLLEALHCGIPTVSVDIPVLREVGGDACLWSERDYRKFSSQLESIIISPELAADLSSKGVTQAAEFSWDKTAEILKQRLLEDTPKRKDFRNT